MPKRRRSPDLFFSIGPLLLFFTSHILLLTSLGDTLFRARFRHRQKTQTLLPLFTTRPRLQRPRLFVFCFVLVSLSLVQLYNLYHLVSFFVFYSVLPAKPFWTNNLLYSLLLPSFPSPLLSSFRSCISF